MLEFGAVGWLIVGTIVLVAIVLLIVLIARRRKRRLNDERPRNARERRLMDTIGRLTSELESRDAKIKQLIAELLSLGHRTALRILLMNVANVLPPDDPEYLALIKRVGAVEGYNIEQDYPLLLAIHGHHVPLEGSAMGFVLDALRRIVEIVEAEHRSSTRVLDTIGNEVRTLDEQDNTGARRAVRLDVGSPGPTSAQQPTRTQGRQAPKADATQMPVPPAPGHGRGMPSDRPVAAAPASPAAWPPGPGAPRRLTSPPATPPATGADGVLSSLRREEGTNKSRRRRGVDLSGEHPDAATMLARLDPLEAPATQDAVPFKTVTLRLHFSQGAPYLVSSWETTEAFKARGGVPTGDELEGDDLEYARQHFAALGSVVKVEVIRA